MTGTETEVKTGLTCYHCGSACEETLWLNDKSFCCFGCKTVFEILSANDLCEYYSMDANPGVQLRNISDETYAYLDEPDITSKVVTFNVDHFVKVKFYIPAIHCVSCIWLLENLQKVNQGIRKSEVNFARKTVEVDFSSRETSLGAVARLLGSLGYAPKINLDAEGDAAASARRDKTLVTKLAVAGFCFGNVMLFSFPEYLGLDHNDTTLKTLFGWLNLALSIPVFFYSGFDYFRASVRSIKDKQINIDVPIAVGLLALFLRSGWDILTGFGPGYFDSFTGLVFFLLIGRWFQSKTYETLAFDRDFKSYFPLAVHKLVKDEWKPVVIYTLRRSDQIRIRNMEIIPADCILLDEEALIDYSFVTGESKPVAIKQGELIYAGGRLVGQPVTMVVEKKTSQSHLTSLWNHEAFQKISESRYQRIIDLAARRFTWVVLFIALGTAVYWQIENPGQMWLVLTSVLMVACPCALALAAPFTYGSMLRVFGRHNFYLKNADIIERLAAVDAVVFDKTGTVTHGDTPQISFTGTLDMETLSAVRKLTSFSTHPLSSMISRSLPVSAGDDVTDFREIPGKGIEGRVGAQFFRIGSPAFTGMSTNGEAVSSRVYISVNDEPRGYFQVNTSVRNGIGDMLKRLGTRCKGLLSGDNDSDRARMQQLFPAGATLAFNQDPHEKLNFIRGLQQEGSKVLMLGDGLNDSGALRQSDAGIAVTDDTGIFTPACDGILHGSKVASLDKFLSLARSSATILKTGFAISFLYNAVALSVAVSGHLTPFIAAVLMPLSSISVVGFTSLAVNFVARRKAL